MSYTLDTYDPDADFDRWYTDECGKEIDRGLTALRAAKILEVGCATGRMTEQFSRLWRQVDGISLDKEMIARARARRLPGVMFYTMNVLDLIAPKFYDAIVCASMLHEALDPEAILDKCNTLLAPGGHMFVTVPNANSIHHDKSGPHFSERARKFGVKRLLTPTEWHDIMITRTGFRVVEREEMMAKPYPNAQMACLPPGMLDHFATYRGPGGAIVYFELVSIR